VLVAVDVVAGGPLVRLDIAVARILDDHIPWNDRWMFDRARIAGEWRFLAPLVAITTVIAAVRCRSWRPVVTATATVTVTAGVVWLTKVATGRTGPLRGDPVLFTDAMAFPSGHATNSVVLVGLIWSMVALVRSGTTRWMTPARRTGVICCTGLAAGVGMVGLGYHWTSDVVAGWLLGAAILCAGAAVDPLAGVGPTPQLRGGGADGSPTDR